jgi:hypothetical protein
MYIDVQCALEIIISMEINTLFTKYCTVIYQYQPPFRTEV